jgi:hypothetical protein
LIASFPFGSVGTLGSVHPSTVTSSKHQILVIIGRHAMLVSLFGFGPRRRHQYLFHFFIKGLARLDCHGEGSIRRKAES